MYFFVHFHHTILAAALQGQQRTNIFLLCALFFPEVFDKNCSIVLFFLTAGYYSAILLLTLDTHKLITSGGFSVWNTSPTSARTAAISHSTMQWDDVVKEAASAKKKGAWHVDMVNILWIKRKKPSTFCNADGKKCRSGGIRTRGLLVPNQTRYQTALHLEKRANRGTRTLDLRFTKPLLYRLSHVGTAETIQLY